jgi:hypothetical protein
MGGYWYSMPNGRFSAWPRVEGRIGPSRVELSRRFRVYPVLHLVKHGKNCVSDRTQVAAGPMVQAWVLLQLVLRGLLRRLDGPNEPTLWRGALVGSQVIGGKYFSADFHEPQPYLSPAEIPEACLGGS